MAKPRADSGAEVSLFPFLSILACIIGCLTMVIVALSIIQMNQRDAKDPGDVQRAKDYLLIEKEKEADAKKISELKALIEAVVLNREQINQKREALKQIKAMLDKSMDVVALRDELIAELNRLKQQLTSLTKDHEELMAKIEELKAVIAERKLKPDLPSVVVRPTGSGVGLRPFFCRGQCGGDLVASETERRTDPGADREPGKQRRIFEDAGSGESGTQRAVDFPAARRWDLGLQPSAGSGGPGGGAQREAAAGG